MPTPVPTEPSPSPTETPTTPGGTETPTGTPTGTPPPSPTPILTGPDDPSLYGWPSRIGGTPLWISQDLVSRYSQRDVVARINAGGPELITSDGAVWSADFGFKGGQEFRRRSDAEIAGTDDDALFRTERRSTKPGGRFRYAIPVPETNLYTVRLYFVAVTYRDHHGATLTGKRVMNVNVEGGPRELHRWDVYGENEPLELIVQTFDVEVFDGELNIVFDGVEGRAGVAAIEVLGPERTVGDAIVEFALQYLGAPYVWATHGPSTFDCSGFTDWVALNVLGVHIGYNQVEQVYYGTAVAYADLRPGDLVFFQNTHPIHEGVSHVGIYIGGGRFVHASTMAGVVTIDDLTSGYYAAHYYGAVRLA
ncbi:MAG TPA: NlpC/P60 family protein [Thermomicrobiales bacterium]